jgi:hypothetical protein
MRTQGIQRAPWYTRVRQIPQRAQEGRDALCTPEDPSPFRANASARPLRCTGRVPPRGHRPKPKDTRQSSLASAASNTGRIVCVSDRPSVGRLVSVVAARFRRGKARAPQLPNRSSLYLDCETDRTACWRNSMGSRSPCCASSMIFLARASATGPLRSTRNVPNASSNARTKTLISSGPNEAFCRSRVIGIMPPNRTFLWVRHSTYLPSVRGGIRRAPRKDFSSATMTTGRSCPAMRDRCGCDARP